MTRQMKYQNVSLWCMGKKDFENIHIQHNRSLNRLHIIHTSFCYVSIKLSTHLYSRCLWINFLTICTPSRLLNTPTFRFHKHVYKFTSVKKRSDHISRIALPWVDALPRPGNSALFPLHIQPTFESTTNITSGISPCIDAVQFTPPSGTSFIMFCTVI